MTTVPHESDSWRKSSRSPQGSDCVEVHMASRRAIRDSKKPDVILEGVDVTALLRAAKAGLLG